MDAAKYLKHDYVACSCLPSQAPSSWANSFFLVWYCNPVTPFTHCPDPSLPSWWHWQQLQAVHWPSHQCLFFTGLFTRTLLFHSQVRMSAMNVVEHSQQAPNWYWLSISAAPVCAERTFLTKFGSAPVHVELHFLLLLNWFPVKCLSLFPIKTVTDTFPWNSSMNMDFHIKIIKSRPKDFLITAVFKDNIRPSLSVCISSFCTCLLHASNLQLLLLLQDWLRALTCVNK